jgi:branched-chain amino acid transport system substrate-binding protein
MNIGILYPRSTAHPELMVDYMDGIKTALIQNGLDQSGRLFSESIGFGGAEKEVYEKAEKLILLEKVDMLVAYIDLRVAPILEPLMESSGKLLLIVNPGANHPEGWVVPPNTLYLTLQHAFLCWLTGSLIKKEENKNAAYATTFYDCGYLHGASMVRGLTAVGGAITFNYINNQAYNDAFDIKQLAGFLAEDKTTDNLVCVMDAYPASLFYKLLNKEENAKRLNLLVSPMMLEEAALKDIGDGFAYTIEGYLPWIAEQENAANKAFSVFYQGQTKRTPSVFSLLGWETALVIKQLVMIKMTDPVKMINGLTGITLDSPRGPLKLDKQTCHFIAPIHRCLITRNTTKPVTEWITDIDAPWSAFAGLPAEGPSSGWSNTYLCY